MTGIKCLNRAKPVIPRIPVYFLLFPVISNDFLHNSLTNFQGWRTGFYDPQLNSMIDHALLERDAQKQVADYQAIQARYDQLIPALIPLSQMVDSVVVRNEVREYQPHPSATTFLRDVYKIREGEKG